MNKLALILFAAPAFCSQLLYSNLGAPPTQYSVGGWIVNDGHSAAVGFTPSVTATLTEIEAPISWNGFPDQPLLAQLVGPYPASDQVPGIPPAVLESWMLTPGEVGFTVAIVQLVSTINPTLAAGQKYFLQLSSTGLTSSSRWIWNVNNQGVNGWAQGSTSGWAFSNNAAPAFAVYGADAVDTGIPEPVPAALLGTGLLLGLLHRRSARSGVCNPNQ